MANLDDIYDIKLESYDRRIAITAIYVSEKFHRTLADRRSPLAEYQLFHQGVCECVPCVCLHSIDWSICIFRSFRVQR